MTFSLIAYATKDNVVNVDIFPSLELTAISSNARPYTHFLFLLHAATT